MTSSATTHKVRVWKLAVNDAGNPEVRWITAGREHSASFVQRGLAESFRSELITAMRKGEAFSISTGLPDSMARRADKTWYDLTLAYVDRKWRRLAATSRRATADSLATLTVAIVSTHRGAPAPKLLRKALYGWAYNPKRRSAEEPPDDVAAALKWIASVSLPISALAEDSDNVTNALDWLALKMDGKPAAPNTIRRKRAVFYNVLRYAVERKHLVTNPLDEVQWEVPKAVEEVDRRVVANPLQVRALLDAVRAMGRRGRPLVAFFALMYHAALRPAEANALTITDCDLPPAYAQCRTCGAATKLDDDPDGRKIRPVPPCQNCSSSDTHVTQEWGTLTLVGSAPRSGTRWTDDGAQHQQRQLKHRARDAVRVVPIPPVLVRLLRAHIAAGISADGRLFSSTRGGYIQEREYTGIWSAARIAVFTAAQVSSPLARRPYDLRHAGVSLWLRSGVDVTEVARRAGHSVAVLLRIYAGVLDGIEAEANRKIDRALWAIEEADTSQTDRDNDTSRDDESGRQ